MHERFFTFVCSFLLFILAFASPAYAHKTLLPGLGAPLTPGPCDGESLLTSRNNQKLKDVVDRQAKILRDIYAGETKYSRWIHGFWARDYRATMELWGFTNPKKYRQFALEVERLMKSETYSQSRSPITDNLETLLQIQAGDVRSDLASQDPLFGANKLARQILILKNTIRRALKNDPEVRRLWIKRIQKRLSLPPEQMPAETYDTADYRSSVLVKAQKILEIPGAPRTFSATRSLSDHSFMHYANGLVGFERPKLVEEFFVRDIGNRVVRGHIDIYVVLGAFLSEVYKPGGRVSLRDHKSERVRHSDNYRTFEFAYQFPGYTLPHKFKAVVCWNPNGCMDREKQLFSFGEVVSLFPRCGPDVYMIPDRDVFKQHLKNGWLDQGLNEKYIENCK